MLELKPFIVTYLPWLLSCLTVWMTVLQGNLKRSSWLVGLFNQLLWLLWICLSENWGLLLLNFTLWYVYARNYLKWRTANVGS